MQKRILFLDALSEVAGGQRVLLQLAPALARYELHALLPQPGPLSEQLETEGVYCHFTPMADFTLVRKTASDVYRFTGEQLALARQCQRLTRRYSIDLVYANSSRTFVWGALSAQWSRLPIIWHLHNIIGDDKTRALLKSLGRLPAVRRIIAASQLAADQLDNLASKTVVAPVAVDTAAFRPDPEAGMRVRAELGIGADALVVGIGGDLIPLKGQRTVLKACNSLSPAPMCLVVGTAREGDSASLAYASELHKLASDRTIFTGKRNDMPAVLNAMDLLVIASERETGPLVLLEGMACGIPVISTRVGRAPELLPEECLIPHGEAGALASAIRCYLADPDMRVSLGIRNREIAEDRLSIRQFQQFIAQEISDLLAEGQ